MEFEPQKQDQDHPWTPELAAHLTRRTGFGVQREHLGRSLELGVQAAVEEIGTQPVEDAGLAALIKERSGDLLDFPGDNAPERSEAIRREWMFRMVHSTNGLRERLVLFWHDHFAVQESKLVHFPIVWGYLSMLREACDQPLRVLLERVARNPGMLLFLDNRVSTREAPNENWARELMELYTLGLDNYSQRDVVELARVFTGWTTPLTSGNEFVFDPEMHDTGDKTFLGETIAGRRGAGGIEEGLEALDILVARPECSLHLSKALLANFADPDPTQEVVEAFARVLQANGLDVMKSLKVLFGSSWFYEPERIYNMVRNPVELVVAQAQALRVRNPDLAGMHLACRGMGMDLLEPPSVGGWDHDQDWFSPMAATGRLAWASKLAGIAHSPYPAFGAAALDLDELHAEGQTQSHGVVSVLVERLGLSTCDDGQEMRLFESWLDALKGRNYKMALSQFSQVRGGIVHRERSLRFEIVQEQREAVRLAVRMVLSLPENCLA